MTVGYSGKPAWQKLGLKPGCRFAVVDGPDDYELTIGGLPPDVRRVDGAKGDLDVVHVFATERARLARLLPALRERIAPAGAIWVSWPKKSAKIPGDLTENVVRELAIAANLVDVKVCAISEVWSGLKLVIRVKDRRPK